MPQDADATPADRSKPPRPKAQPKDAPQQWFTTPQPVKRLFDKFPLVTYPSNQLPQRTARQRDRHALYIFTSQEGASNGVPSFNPGCLKWQAYLKFRNIPYTTVASSNHASPTGALPFLLPAARSSSTTAVPSNRIQRWTRDITGEQNDSVPGSRQSNEAEQRSGNGAVAAAPRDLSSDMRYEAYMALLDHRIRNAFLYSVYLSPANFASIARPLYIDPSSSNQLVRFTLSYQLRSAAEAELFKQTAIIDADAIYCESNKAFGALSELLGEDEYFFGETKPALFDASVFAYTNVLLDEGLGWEDRRMREGLRGCQNLIAHRRRILKAYFQ